MCLLFDVCVFGFDGVGDVVCLLFLFVLGVGLGDGLCMFVGNMYWLIDWLCVELWCEREARRDASGVNDGDGDCDDVSECVGWVMMMGKYDFICCVMWDVLIEICGDGLKLFESSRERRTERNRIESNRIELNWIDVVWVVDDLKLWLI